MLVYNVHILQSIASVYYAHSIGDSFDFCFFIFPPDVLVKTQWGIPVRPCECMLWVWFSFSGFVYKIDLCLRKDSLCKLLLLNYIPYFLTSHEEKLGVNYAKNFFTISQRHFIATTNTNKKSTKTT